MYRTLTLWIAVILMVHLYFKGNSQEPAESYWPQWRGVLTAGAAVRGNPPGGDFQASPGIGGNDPILRGFNSPPHF